MSRAFVKEDDYEQEPEYRLPEPDSPYYAEAAAWALIQGADAGDGRSAELATGFRWGDPALVAEVESILEKGGERGSGSGGSAVSPIPLERSSPNSLAIVGPRFRRARVQSASVTIASASISTR